MPSELEVNFFHDGTGSVYYALHVTAEPMPRTVTTDLQWTADVDGSALSLTWPGRPLITNPLSLMESSFTVFDGNGDEVTFTRKLVPSIHFFPLGAGFPDGWPVEYFGYSTGSDT